MAPDPAEDPLKEDPQVAAATNPDAQEFMTEKEQESEALNGDLLTLSHVNELSTAEEKLILNSNTTVRNEGNPPDDQPTLLGLPYEIRKRILRYLLSTELQDNRRTGYRAVMKLIDDEYADEEIDGDRRNITFDEPQKFLDAQFVATGGYTLYPNIMWTCKQLFKEGSEELVKDNKYIALHYPASPEHIGEEIQDLMADCGIQTFWVNPGIFKSTPEKHGRPVITIDMEFSNVHSKPLGENVAIVPFEDLSQLSQALSGWRSYLYEADYEFLSDIRCEFQTEENLAACSAHLAGLCPWWCESIWNDVDEKSKLRFRLDICVPSIPGWKQRGFKSVMEELQNELFDWFGESILQVFPRPVSTGLGLEVDLRKWILHQGTLPCTLESSEWNKRYLRRFVSRFRNAESQFLSGDVVAACTSFGKLNALVAFSHWGRMWLREDLNSMREVADWTHFYLALSLVEQADIAFKGHNYHQCYDQLKIALLHLPDFDSFDQVAWFDLTPGQEARLYFAKAEAWCTDPWEPGRSRRCRNYASQTMRAIEWELGYFYCQELNEFKELWDICVRDNFTMPDFEDIKDRVKKLLLETFGPLEPVKLILEQKDSKLDAGS